MRHFTFLFVLVPLTLFSQNYYDTNNPVEKLLNEKKFKDALLNTELFIKQKKHDNVDEFNYLMFLKHFASAQLLISNNNSITVTKKDIEKANFFLKNSKNISVTRRCKFYFFYVDFLSENNENKKAAQVCVSNISYLLNQKKSKEIKLELANFYTLYAILLSNENNIEKAQNYAEKASTIYKTIDSIDNYFFSANNHLLGYIYIMQGFDDKSEEHLIMAIKSLENKDDSKSLILLTKVLELLITNKTNYGNSSQAELYLEKYKRVVTKIIDKKDPISYDYVNIQTRFYASSIYLFSTIDENRMTASLNNLKKSINFNRLYSYSDEVVYMLSTSFANAAVYYRQLNEHQKAIEINEMMLDKLKNIKNSNFSVYLNGNLAYVYSDLQNNLKALEYIKKAISSAKKLSLNTTAYETLQSELLLKIKTTKNVDQNTLEVLNKMTVNKIKYSKIVDIDYEGFKGLNSERDILIILSFAKVYHKIAIENDTSKNNLKIAYKLYDIAAKMFNSYYKKGIYNSSLSNLILKINDGLLSTSFDLQNNDTKNLLSIIENNTSKYLWNEFILKNKSIQFGKADQLIKEIKKVNLLKNKSISNRESMTEKNPDKYEELTNKIVKYEQKEKELLSNIKAINKEYDNFSNPRIDINGLQHKLKENQTILRFVVTLSKVFLFEVNNKSIDFYCIGERATIIEQAKEFNKKLSQNNPTFKNLSQELYRILIPKKIKQQQILIIICDDFLNYIPFESLQTTSNEFLINSNIISYANSLLFFQNQFTKKNISQNKLIAFAPLYDKKSTQEDIAYLQRSGLYELKGAQNEAKKITDQFSGILINGKNASKNLFLEEASKYQIIHLAMHSILDESKSENSSLVFSGNEKLYFSELYGLNIPAEMVVLSACNTGAGVLKNGEGIMSMSRAFIFAGVKSTVISLWQVPDKETSEIMISFYENLKKGQSKDEALANSKTTFITKNPMKNHPFYWAGFVVNGDVSPIISNSNWILYVGIGLAFLLLIFLFRKKLFQFQK